MPSDQFSNASMMMAYDANKKSVGVAYLLWFFLGGFGGHRFYLGSVGLAVTQLVLTVLGAVLSFVGVGLALLAVVGIWVLIDAFLIPGMISAYNNGVRLKLMAGGQV
ncbi:MAG: TM2 domain-containing protein [Zavarzinia sp.]|nr:TM2 domain-containing protein [Zavarzinia sp.]